MITTRQSEGIEKLLREGYRERGMTKDEEWKILENDTQGIIYDLKKDRIVGTYPIERWQK